MTAAIDTTFLDALASGEPTPGGGGAAALMGAMGAALISMVCNLTIGKKGYEAVEEDMRELLDESESLRASLQGMVADDAAAFDRLMSAYRLPKATDEEKTYRSAAIQNGLKAATTAPLDCARAAAEVIRLTARASERGNTNVISDVGVGALAGWAALRSAALNVKVNVPQLKDRTFADHALTEIAALLDECGPLADAVHARVVAKLA
jgi:methenyltetrahydrofolate cyclohydrolase